MRVQNAIKHILLAICFITSSVASAQIASTDSVVLEAIIESCTPYEATHNNKIKLFKQGADKFTDMFAEIEKAKDHIHLDYFNFRNDSLGNALFDLLEKKAEEGVEVRAIFDAFGNSSNNRPLKREQIEGFLKNDVEVHKFKPMRFPYLNSVLSRDHRKIVVIDGTIAYTGGMNVADYYIAGRPKFGEWHDMHLKVEGDAVYQLQDLFLKMWNSSTKQDIKGEKYFPSQDTLLQGNKTMIIVDRTPKINPKGIRCAYNTSIANAKKSIKIANPYFVPTHSVKKSIKQALKRGIEVEIMVSSKADIPFTPKAALSVAQSLSKKGAKVYLFNEGFNHAKIMIVDESFCTVGSANLDSRSLRYDYEVNAFIFDIGTTLELNSMFEEDKRQSTLLTKEFWEGYSCWKKFVGQFARLFTAFL